MTSDERAARRQDRLRIASIDLPGWCTGDGSVPQVGECVFCLDGQAEVVRVLGRTGDGSRLIELRLAEGPKAPYFAASSNILRRSRRSVDDASASDAATQYGDPVIGGSSEDFIGAPQR